MTSETLLHVKANPVRLAPNASSEEAFIAIIGGCLRHAEANQPAVQQGQIEGVHQMRVAFRRLRSGLKIFRPLIPRETSATLVADLRWLNGFLGPARDWDVFLEEGMAPVFAHFPRKRSLSLFRGAAEILRQRHHQTLRDALEQPHYSLMMQRFADWLERRAWREDLSDEQRQPLAEPVLEFATPLLECDHRRAMKRGEAFAGLSAEERHALRIRIKELRYALDFFASLYPVPAVRMVLSALSDVQDCLGVMNDITVARRLLDEAGLKPLSIARQVIEGWYGCRLDIHERQFAEVWRRYQECERPWKD
ncbi:MAG TPA: CHAD domain-containing protein [Candidatus Competibacteraceae bacterium]|nr:CHAD domain-containing protein [Candidatus Competibacteraceae bacterium]HRZ04953.1 CHAD domain-containing protein [Candidatus Competibacteraceae bacterium]HSA46015.1 CHAD domain-containing protein [Candidatus Competibacteraceae bacterium]